MDDEEECDYEFPRILFRGVREEEVGLLIGPLITAALEPALRHKQQHLAARVDWNSRLRTVYTIGL